MKLHLSALVLTTALLAGTAMAQDTVVFATTNNEDDLLTTGFFNAWVERVEASSGGALDVEFRYGPMIANHINFYDRMADGVIDMAWGVSVFNPGKFSQLLVGTLPFTTQSAAEGAEVFCRMYEAGVFDKTFDDIIPLLFLQMPQAGIGTSERSIQTMDDLAGVKLITASPASAGVLGDWKAAPLSLQVTETYEALQRGTAEGFVLDFNAMDAFNLHEVTNHFFEVPMGSPFAGVFMSRAKFDSLSPESQQAIRDNSTCADARSFGEFVDGNAAQSREHFLAMEGRSITAASPDVVKMLEERHSEGLRNGFGEAVEGGRELIDALMATIADVRAAN